MTKRLITENSGSWVVVSKDHKRPVIEIQKHDPRSGLHVSSYIVLDELEEMRNVLSMATTKQELEG